MNYELSLMRNSEPDSPRGRLEACATMAFGPLWGRASCLPYRDTGLVIGVHGDRNVAVRDRRSGLLHAAEMTADRPASCKNARCRNIEVVGICAGEGAGATKGQCSIVGSAPSPAWGLRVSAELGVRISDFCKRLSCLLWVAVHSTQPSFLTVSARFETVQ